MATSTARLQAQLAVLEAFCHKKDYTFIERSHRLVTCCIICTVRSFVLQLDAPELLCGLATRFVKSAVTEPMEGIASSSDDAPGPRTVKALLCEKLGHPTEELGSSHGPLRLAHLPPPDLVHGNDVRIKIKAAAMNYADALLLEGKYQEKPRLPFVPGSECSGVVTEVGHDVRTVAVGDRVCALMPGGGAFTEEAVVRENMVIRLPADGPFDFEAAAGLPVTFGTAYISLVDRANLRPGQTLLVMGAAGGVGLAAVQLGKALGANVVAVARGSRKARVLADLGADAVIDMEHRRPDQLKGLVAEAAPTGAHVVFDPVGGPLAQEALRCCAWGAQFCTIGFVAGIPKLPANLLLVKNVTLHGVYWGSYAKHQPLTFRRSLEEVAKLLGQGRVRVHISHVYSLEEAPEAFSVLLSRQVVGKLLLLPGPRTMAVRAAL